MHLFIVVLNHYQKTTLRSFNPSLLQTCKLKSLTYTPTSYPLFGFIHLILSAFYIVFPFLSLILLFLCLGIIKIRCLNYLPAVQCVRNTPLMCPIMPDEKKITRVRLIQFNLAEVRDWRDIVGDSSWQGNTECERWRL